MKMNKLWIVAGDNGCGNSGNTVFGLYLTKEQAVARVKQLKDDDAGCEYMYYDEVQLGDFKFSVEG